MAAWQGKLTAVRLLLNHGASVRALNNYSWTPLHQASWYGYPDVIQLLVERGADVEARDRDRNTPLHLAAWHGELAAARLLVKNYASTRALNKNSYTPLHLALQYKHSDVIEFLLEEYSAEADDIEPSTASDKASGEAKPHNSYLNVERLDNAIYANLIREWCFASEIGLRL